MSDFECGYCDKPVNMDGDGALRDVSGFPHNCPIATAKQEGRAETVSVTLPLRLVSILNEREHPQARARRTKQHRQLAKAKLRVPLFGIRLPVLVRITRIGIRKLDSDNLQGSAKAVRDGIADAIGIDDGDPRIAWIYDQKKGKYAVEICVEEVAESAA